MQEKKPHKNLESSFPILWETVSKNGKEATNNGEQLLDAARDFVGFFYKDRKSSHHLMD